MCVCVECYANGLGCAIKQFSSTSVLILDTILTHTHTMKHSSKQIHKVKPMLSPLTNCIDDSCERNPCSHKPRVRLYAKNEDPTNDNS